VNDNFNLDRDWTVDGICSESSIRFLGD